MQDFLLPVINVGIFPSGSETKVSLYPNDSVIDVHMYAIGDLNPEDFFPNPNLKKK